MTETRQEQQDRRDRVRREEDELSLEEFVKRSDLLACVKKDELEKIITDAVNAAIQSYQHKCIMELKAEDVPAVRDLVGALKELDGHGSLSRAVVIVRENHKFITSMQKAATKIGWGVLIVSVSIMGALGLLAAGVWKQSGGS